MSMLSTMLDGASFGVPYTLDPRTASTARTWPLANRCVYNRVSGSGPVSSIRIRVVTSSGNISVGHYTSSASGIAGRAQTRQVTSGAVACPASGSADVSLGASTTVGAGDWFAMSCDNTTASFAANAAPSGSNLLPGFEMYQSSAHPCPSTATDFGVGGYTPVMQGVA